MGVLSFLASLLLSAALVLAELDLDTLAKVPPGMIVSKYERYRVYDGYLVFCPEYFNGEDKIYHGPRIFHPSGSVFWAGNEWKYRCMNAQIQKWNGQNVLTFWYDNDLHPYGAILDQNYNEIKQVHPIGGPNTDLHEFRITEGGQTALMILMKTLPANLRPFGGLEKSWLYTPFIQEIDIETGHLLWEWSAAEHLDFSASRRELPPSVFYSWEYAHCNTVFKDHEGFYYMSFRYYSMVAKVDPHTKEIIWQMGGIHSDFKFNNGSAWIGQHEPKFVPGTNYTQMTIFDNDHDECGTPSIYGTARGLWLQVDYDKWEVSLLREYLPSVRQPATIEGGLQILPNGNVLVAYGSSGHIIEYVHTGHGPNDNEIVFESWASEVYRAFKYPKNIWKGQGLPDPHWGQELVQIDDDVSMVFDSGERPDTCTGFRSLFGMC